MNASVTLSSSKLMTSVSDSSVPLVPSCLAVLHPTFALHRDNIVSLRRQCEDLEADEAELSNKIKKKRNDLERGEKRLKSLQVRDYA